MRVVETAIPALKVLAPKKFVDRRGFFSETYSKAALASIGIDLEFVQDNHPYSIERGVIRGLHYQIQPFAQDKLIRVVRGAIVDVAVDIRRGSPTFGRHVCVPISAEAWNQILVPVGFAHGCCVTEPHTEIIYKVSRPYAVEYERGIGWDDPELGIAWPVSAAEAILSNKDRNNRCFAEVSDWFDFAPSV